jgi:hypothetical protein
LSVLKKGGKVGRKKGIVRRRRRSFFGWVGERKKLGHAFST